MNDQINKLISRVFSDKISPYSKKDENIDLSNIIDLFCYRNYSCIGRRV